MYNYLYKKYKLTKKNKNVRRPVRKALILKKKALLKKNAMLNKLILKKTTLNKSTINKSTINKSMLNKASLKRKLLKKRAASKKAAVIKKAALLKVARIRQRTRLKICKPVKPAKVDHFYWKYIYGDLVISKFINFLVKSGYKNRAIKFFFKALLNLKGKFGINPILFIKYIILKRNTLHKVTQKKVKKKTFYYLRIMDFDKQMSNTIRKIMTLVLFIKEKKQLKLWQSIMIILLNFCVKKKKKKINTSIKYNTVLFNKKMKRIMSMYSSIRFFKTVSNKYISLHTKIKKNIFLFSRSFIFFSRYKKYIISNIDNISVPEIGILLLFVLYNKAMLYYAALFRIRLLFMSKKKLGFRKLKKLKKKIKRFFSFLKRLKSKYLLKKINKYNFKSKKRKALLKEKLLFKNRDKQGMIARAYFKELKEFKKASKFRNSFLNFKLLNKKRRELSMGIRLHAKHDVRLKHRKIFFRVSKHGQVKK